MVVVWRWFYVGIGIVLIVLSFMMGVLGFVFFFVYWVGGLLIFIVFGWFFFEFCFDVCYLFFCSKWNFWE